MLRIHFKPFRLGLTIYSYGIIYRWRGQYRAIGRNPVDTSSHA